MSVITTSSTSFCAANIPRSLVSVIIPDITLALCRPFAIWMLWVCLAVNRYAFYLRRTTPYIWGLPLHNPFIFTHDEGPALQGPTPLTAELNCPPHQSIILANGCSFPVCVQCDAYGIGHGRKHGALIIVCATQLPTKLHSHPRHHFPIPVSERVSNNIRRR